MKICGLQKMTLLDYPAKVACTVFTEGCNLRCPFCHNAGLVNKTVSEAYPEEEILGFLAKRCDVLDGVCITGGEPLLQPDIEAFIYKIKKIGYSVKLDTNGTMPERLKKLIDNKYVDYVAMDVKNRIEKYSLSAGADMQWSSSVEKSIDILLEGKVDYEFRTTVVKELHTVSDIEALAKRISGAKNYFLQQFVDSGNLICGNLTPHDVSVLETMREVAARYTQNVQLRGV